MICEPVIYSAGEMDDPIEQRITPKMSLSRNRPGIEIDCADYDL